MIPALAAATFRATAWVVAAWALAAAGAYLGFVLPRELGDAQYMNEEARREAVLEPVTIVTPGNFSATIGTLRAEHPDLLDMSLLRYRFVDALRARLRALDEPVTADDATVLNAVVDELAPRTVAADAPADYALSQKRELRGVVSWSRYRLSLDPALAACGEEPQCLKGYLESVAAYCAGKPPFCGALMGDGTTHRLVAKARELAPPVGHELAVRLEKLGQQKTGP